MTPDTETNNFYYMIDTDKDTGFGYGLKSGEKGLIGPGSNDYGRSSGFFSRKDAGGFPDAVLKEQLQKALENMKDPYNIIPRRNRLDSMVPAELAINNAIEEVEKIGADTRLTEAVILLNDAMNKVADYIDSTSSTGLTTATGTTTLTT